jgi:tetratricopeptide (TPR) repeat protein
MSKDREKRKAGGGAPPTDARGVTSRRPRVGWLVAAIAIALAVAIALVRATRGGRWRPRGAVPASTATFAGRGQCIACHAREDSLWRSSHHALAMQPATPATVLGDFTGAKFTHFGVTSTFTKRDDKYFVRTDGPDGALHEYEIAYTFGVYPLQQYLIAFPGGRYQALNVAWDARPAKEGGQRWFHLYPKEAVAHDDILHWTGPYQNWNFMCAECHSTNVAKGYDAATDTYRTTYSEIDVSCEACHGPGSAHVAWARASGADTLNVRGENDGLQVALRDSAPATWSVDAATHLPRRSTPRTSHAEIEMCGRCHSRRSVLTERYEPGRPLADTHRPVAIDDPYYFADGQLLEEAYEYTSFRESRMFHAGVTCTDCHDPHRTTIAAPVDAVCARCHPSDVFAATSHTHHAAASPGSSCTACHMPTRDFMVVHARHDHSIRVPRPDLTVTLGVPNACAACHAAKGAAWAATAATKWWPDLSTRPSFASAIDLGRRAASGADTALVALIVDTTRPAVARASAVNLLARDLSASDVSSLQLALWDKDPLVRAAGAQAAAALDPTQRVRLLAPLLTDSVRLVRIDAARALATAPTSTFDTAQRTAFARAIGDYREEQRVNGDRAEAHLSLGAFFAETGRLDSAAVEYSTALKMNPQLLASYVNLADLYRQQGQDDAAEKVLRAGLAHAPKGSGAELQYALGLVYIREKRVSDAIAPLAAATRLAPTVARYPLVYALALQQVGRKAEARAVLEHALAAHPDDHDLQQAYAALVRPNAGR